MNVRCHTFSRAGYILYADRVPAMHGRCNMFTLWHLEGNRIRRLIGGVSMSELRRFLKDRAT